MRKNKTLKSFFCILLAFAMVFSMSIMAFANVNDGTGADGDTETVVDASTEQYTVQVTPKDSAAHTFAAYQIFKGTLNKDYKYANSKWNIEEVYLTDVEWGSNVIATTKVDEKDIYQALTGESAFVVDGENIFTGCASAADVAKALSDYRNTTGFAEKFADIVNKYITGEAVATKDVSGGAVAELEVTGAGYYLIKDSGTITDPNAAYTDFILQVVNDVEVEAKAEVPSLDKVIVQNGANNATNDVKASTASIGDKIKYKLTAQVPDMSAYDRYYFVVNDTLDAGLTFDETKGITIKISNNESQGNETEYADLPITVTKTDNKKSQGKTYYVEYDSSAHTLKIVFNNFIQYKEYVGAVITIEYEATLNEEAEITQSGGNQNKASLTFPNNPNFDYKGKHGTSDDPEDPDLPDEPEDDPKDGTPDPTGKTPESTVTTFTTAIRLLKQDGAGKALSGAKFKLSGTAVKAIVTNEKIYQRDDANGTYYMLKNGRYTETSPTGLDEEGQKAYDDPTGAKKYKEVEHVKEDTVTEAVEIEAYVDEQGYLTFKGLGAGEYTIQELIAPDGFNLLKESIKVTISGTPATNVTPNTCAWKVVVKQGSKTTLPTTLVKENSTDEDATVYQFVVENHKGVLLPGAGGMGTTIIYVLGVAFLVAAGVIFFITRRKTENTK